MKKNLRSLRRSKDIYRFVETNSVVLFVVLAYVILTAKFFRFIYRFTENILFWDQWDIFDQVLHEQNIVNLFLVQHNEHRMGVGLVFIKLLATVSSWNVLAETIFIGILITCSCLLALRIKWILTKKIEIFDIVIPFFFFNVYQYENLLWGFQIAFVLPLFWLFSAVYLFTWNNSLLRNALLVLITFLSTYSHFHGILVGLLIAAFFLLQCFTDIQSKQKRLFFFLFFLSSAIVSTYALGYKPVRYLGPTNFRLSDLCLYFIVQVNAFMGNYSRKIPSLIMPVVALGTFVHLILLSRKADIRKRYFPILGLIGFSIAFSLITFLGRGGVGIGAAQTSRYVTFLIPLYFGIHAYLADKLPEKIKASFMTFAVFFLVLFSSQNNYFNFIYAQERKQSLKLWKDCYLQFRISQSCDIKTKVLIYHSPDKIHLQSKLEDLETRQLNLFRQ